MLKRFQKDAVIATRPPDYFAGKPAVDGLVFAITPDASVRLQRSQTRRMPDCPVAEASGCGRQRVR